MDKADAFVVGFGLGSLAISLLAVVLIPDHPTHNQKINIICNHEGGKVHGDVCIKDGKVLEIYV